jgi:hypothetical protein
MNFLSKRKGKDYKGRRKLLRNKFRFQKMYALINLDKAGSVLESSELAAPSLFSFTRLESE